MRTALMLCGSATLFYFYSFNFTDSGNREEVTIETTNQQVEVTAVRATEDWSSLIDEGKYSKSCEEATEFVTPMLDHDNICRVSGYYIR